MKGLVLCLLLSIFGSYLAVPRSNVYFLNDSSLDTEGPASRKLVRDVSANLDFESTEMLVVEAPEQPNDQIPVLRRQRMISKKSCPNDENAQLTGGLDVRIAQLVETAASLGKGSLKVMYPGTLWCGPGHTAPDEKTLGRKRFTDKCCREHDNCPLSMAPGEVMNDLKNNGIFTRSHCDCDEKFHACLVNSTRTTSDQIGLIYFNMLEPQCFREDFPIVKCDKRVKNKCVAYAKNTKMPKKWQWMDTKYYPQ